MARKKAVEDDNMDDLAAQLAEATGGDVLEDLGMCTGFIDTGSLALNYSCSKKFIGGGIPRGRITELYGPSSSGKSLFASHIMHGCQALGGWAVLLDVENAANLEFMRDTCHINSKQLLRYGPEKVETLEKCFLMMHNITKQIRELEIKKGMDKRPIVIIYDSIAGSPCQRELSESDLPFEYTPGDWKKIVGRNQQPGERAKICSQEFRKLTPMTADRDATIVVLNQVREKIGVMYGSPETTGGGGRALEFYASLRVRLQAKKKIENKRLETFDGVNLSVKNMKNRTCAPFIAADDIKLYFNNGVDPLSGLLKCLIMSERVVMKSAGNFTVAPTYLPDGTSEYNFKASKTENTMDKKVIFDCPRLVDVETVEELEKYLAAFSLGMAASDSGNYKEVGITIDNDGNLIEDSSSEDEE